MTELCTETLIFPIVVDAMMKSTWIQTPKTEEMKNRGIKIMW